MITRILGKKKLQWRYFTGLWVPFVYFLMAVIITWPLVYRIGTTVIGSYGDNVYCVWLLAWFQKAIFELHINPEFVPFFNYPMGWSLAHTDIMLSNVILGLPFSLVGGPIFGYNAVILLSFVLSGWFVYWWVRDITGRQAAALVAGALFAFCAYRLAHVLGHWHLMGTQWLALHYYGLYRLLEWKKFRWSAVLACGLGIGLAGLSTMYYLYMSLIVSVLFVLVYLLFGNIRRLVDPNIWKGLAASALVALPLAVIGLLPHINLATEGNLLARQLVAVDMWSTSLTDYLFPGPQHFLWGPWFAEHIGLKLWVERYVYLGALTMILLAVAVWMYISQPQQRRLIGWLMLVMLGVVVLSMGTTLHWRGEPVQLNPVPEFFKRFSITRTGQIVLPNYLLFKYLPFYSGMRVWERYAVFVMLFASVLGGIAYAWLAVRIRKQGWYVIALVVCLLIIGIDARLKYDILKLEPQPVDQWLAAQPEPGAVALFPADQMLGSRYVYGWLTHQKPLVGMFYGAYLPRSFEEDLPALNSFPSEESVQVLRRRGVRYVLIDKDKDPNWANNLEKALLLGLVDSGTVDQYLILLLPDNVGSILQAGEGAP